jgi:hypothetical protein
MTSTPETSSPLLRDAISNGLERALQGFISAPNDQEARNAIYSALSTMIEIEGRRLVEKHLKVENHEGTVAVTLGGPLAGLFSTLFNQATLGDLRWEYVVELPGWEKPTEIEQVQMTRPYIDPRTNRPTRGRLSL